ncbi:hypothetical protein SPONN_1694 [uncultured Candidatus Thioglobus sp.]|nr:hypothetical protein SPONN_1694 [uncultured Candidatus Thioglobus sp.]
MAWCIYLVHLFGALSRQKTKNEKHVKILNMKKRIYTDTSVIDGCLDVEFEEGSNKIFTEFIMGRSILLISKLVTTELENAPNLSVIF